MKMAIIQELDERNRAFGGRVPESGVSGVPAGARKGAAVP